MSTSEMSTFEMALKWFYLNFCWGHESGFALVFINHDPKTKIIFLIFFKDPLICKYDNIMVIGDFNLTFNNKKLDLLTHSV